MKTTCEGCPTKKYCRIKFIKKVKEICMCKNCLIKTMCNVMCKDRENTFLDLPTWVKQYLDTINHYYIYNGEVEYDKLIKLLEILTVGVDLESKYKDSKQ